MCSALNAVSEPASLTPIMPINFTFRRVRQTRPCHYCKELVEPRTVIAIAAVWKNRKRVAEVTYHVDCAIKRSIKAPKIPGPPKPRSAIQLRLRAKKHYYKKLGRTERVDEIQGLIFQLLHGAAVKAALSASD